MIREALFDYEKLFGKKMGLSLENLDLISFSFRDYNFIHLIGLHKLTDIPIIQKLNNKNNKLVTAESLYYDIKNGKVTNDIFELSEFYDSIKENRLNYFNSERIIRLIRSGEVIHFSPNKVTSKNRTTKLEKIDYIFFEILETNHKNHVNFCLAFSNVNLKNYPSTFFMEKSDFYRNNQDILGVLSLFIDSGVDKEFKIYWENVRKSMKNNTHYKYLSNLQNKYNFNIDKLYQENINKLDICEECLNDINKHYQFLQMEEIQKVYIPYLPEAKKWNNNQKKFLLDKINYNKDYLPNEIVAMLKKIE